MPQHLAVAIDLDGLDAEHVEAQLFEAGAVSVTYTDRRDDAILEPAPGELRLWPSTRIEALFDATDASIEQLGALAVELAARLGIDVARLDVRALRERAWEREWLRDFAPMRFGRRLWVQPTHLPMDPAREVVVRLDPGLAFGTGTHATTRLCLEWLDANVRGGETIVDYGCGSGILAIAALKLGAAQAIAFDIDTQALVATRDNAATNAVLERLEIVARAPAPPTRADCIVANILAGPLCELAPVLSALLRPGGALVLAGLLSAQAPEVVHAYRGRVALAPWRSLDGWVALVGRG